MIAYCFWEKIVSDGSGDQGEGFESRIFSFRFPVYSFAHSNCVSRLTLCLCQMLLFFLFFKRQTSGQMGVETKKKDLGLGFSVLGFRIPAKFVIVSNAFLFFYFLLLIFQYSKIELQSCFQP